MMSEQRVLNGNIPRGIEVLVKKASIDGRFCKLLLKKRSGAASTIGLSLDPSEIAMLDSIPQAQLAAIITGTKVSPNIQNAFMGYTAAIMLAALGATAPISQATAEDVNLDGGARIDIENPTVKPKQPYWKSSDSFIIARAGVLTGIVVNFNGNLMSNVRIEVTGIVLNEMTGAFTEIKLDTVTDSDGSYRIDPAPAGTFTVTAVAVSYIAQYQQNIRVSPNELTTVSFNLSQLVPPAGHRLDIQEH